jgi:hypothetical protein
MINGTPLPESPQPAPGKRGPAVANAEAPSPAPGAFTVSALTYNGR